MTKNQEPRRIADVLPEKKIEFHTDLPRMELSDVADEELVILDAIVIDNFHSQYGTQDFTLIHAKSGETEFTTICSGAVVVEKIRELLKKRAFPVLATIGKPEGKRYWDLM